MKERGFTLVELMIVICVITILACMAMQQSTTFMLKAYRAEAINNISHVNTLVASYFADNEGFPSVAVACPGTSPAPASAVVNICRFNNPTTMCDYTVGNAFSISFNDCAKVRYKYQMVRPVAGASADPSYYIEAISSDRIFNCANSDNLKLNWCGKSWNTPKLVGYDSTAIPQCKSETYVPFSLPATAYTCP